MYARQNEVRCLNKIGGNGLDEGAYRICRVVYCSVVYCTVLYCAVRTDIGFEAVRTLQLVLDAHYSFVVYTDIGFLCHVESLKGDMM